MNKNDSDRIYTTYHEGMIVIHGEVFGTDFESDLLHPVASINDSIDIHAFCKGLNMSGYYQPSTGKLLPEKDPGDPALKFFEIPINVIGQAGRLASEHMEEINAEALKEQKGFQLVTRELAERLNGYLPSIEFDGVRYLIDIERHELLPTNFLTQNLSLNADSHSEPTTIYYDNIDKYRVPDDALPAHIPEHIVLVHFPPLSSLDIVGYTKMAGLPPASLICEVPWRADAGKIKQEPLSKADAARQSADQNRKEAEKREVNCKNSARKGQRRRR